MKSLRGLNFTFCPEATAQALCMGERDGMHGQGMFNTGSTQFGRLMMLEGHDVKRRLSRP